MFAMPALADSLKDEIAPTSKLRVAIAVSSAGGIADYYSEHHGGFWVVVENEKIVGMFGLEPSDDSAMELRRMYVDPDVRRRGIARRMLEFAEQECRGRNRSRLDLSTSELQREALALYENAGYVRVREEAAVVASNKTIGGGIRRYHFTKVL